MTTTLNTKGMMCINCENKVKNGLLKLDHVKSVEADAQSGKVTIESDEDFNIEDAKTLIYDIGYDVI